MRIFSFRGGVHPPYHKDLTRDNPIHTAQVASQMAVPLVQHIGAPCQPAVEKGARVKEGQVIGKADAFVSAPVHSPVSGKVKKIEPVLHPLGQKILSVIIEPDGEEEKEYLEPLGEVPEEIDPKKMLDRIRQAGIVGMGGATFPTHVKFSPPKDKPIDTLVLNGCECEPYLSADHRIMLERSADIVLGARIIARVLQVKKTIIAVETNKMDAAEELQNHLPEGMELQGTRTKYPQGAEKMLIKALLGREVPSGGLPLDVGVVVSNVGTVIAVCEAVREGKPLIERTVTVTGSGVKEPGNFLCRIGVLVGELVKQAGGLQGQPGKLILGGPMMGLAQPSFEVPVIKGTSGVLVMQQADYMRESYLPCIKCSFCVQSCPVGLVPSKLSIIGEAQKWELAENYGVNDCIECGSCAYGCPSKRPIVQLIKTTKAKLKEIKSRE
ncbi:MAG: electron transport complex subunit RsxC [Spirochaetota bacterium]